MKFKSKNRKQKNKELKVLFHFDDHTKESGVELRFISKEEHKKAYDELVKEEVDFVVHPETRKLTKVVTPDFGDNENLENWLIDKMIVGWFGIFIDDDEVLFTKENKIMLYRDYEEFREFIEEKYKLLLEMSKEFYGSDSERKNS